MTATAIVSFLILTATTNSTTRKEESTATNKPLEASRATDAHLNEAGSAVPEIQVPQVSSSSTKDDVILKSRTYTATKIPLQVDTSYGNAIAYGSGHAWVAVGTEGEIWRYDADGKQSVYSLPAGGFRVEGIWPRGAGAVVLGKDQFFSISDAQKEPSRLQTVDAGLHNAVPVRDGYIAVNRHGQQLVYVKDDGERRPISLAPSGSDEREISKLSGDDPPVATREDKEKQPLIKRDRGFLARKALLAEIDQDTLVYVTLTPYQVWIVKLDGSVRHLPIDEGAAMSPESAAGDFAAKMPMWKLGEVEPLGMTRIEDFEGRMAIGKLYQMQLESTDDRSGMPVGTGIHRNFVLIDLVDPATGRIVERIDVSSIGTPGSWAGVNRSQLVFLGLGWNGKQSAYVSMVSGD